MANIGFIGLGNMGLPMALNLVKAGHAVAGNDMMPKGMEALAASGGKAAKSVIEAAEADIVVTMLPAGQQVREVYLGTGGISPKQKRERCSSIPPPSTLRRRARSGPRRRGGEC